jgi:hypothetical protein
VNMPKCFELSFHHHRGYLVDVPLLLVGNDERLPCREDRITEADVEAVARRLCERDHGGPLTLAEAACEGYRDEAETLLALVLGVPLDGKGKR